MSESRYSKRRSKPDPGDLSSHLDPVREYCLAKSGTTDGFPFGPEVMVIKVGGKIFAFLAWEKNPLFISLKCDPERAIELREEYEAVTPGYHLNKQQWNSISLDETIFPELIHELIDQSYDLVFAGLTKKIRESIRQSGN